MQRGLILFAFVAIVTIATIYFTIDVNTLYYLSNFNFKSIMFALIALAIGMYFDGLRLQRLLSLLNYKISLIAVLKVIFGNYFLAMLTPGASGGAVAQVLILKNYGVPIMEGTSIVLIRTIFSILFLCFCLPFIFIFYPISIPMVSNEVLMYGSVFLFVAAFLGIYILQTRFTKIIFFKIAKLTKKLSIKTVLQKLKEINKGFSLLYKFPLQSIVIFIESGLSLLFLYGIAPMLMLAFINDVPIVEILCRMILLNLILYFAPTPGGAGVAEGLFVYLMTPFLPTGVVGIVTIGWRSLAEYLPFFIGMYCVLTLFGNKLNMR